MPLPDGALGVAWLLDKLADPVLIIIAAVATWFWGRTWPTIIAFCVVAAAVQELIAASLHVTQTFDWSLFAMGIAAALVWALAALGVRRLVAVARGWADLHACRISSSKMTVRRLYFIRKT